MAIQETTVRNQLNKAFAELRKDGYQAKRNFACCPGCGEIENKEKFVVTTTQRDRDVFKEVENCYTTSPAIKDGWITIHWSDEKTHEIENRETGEIEKVMTPEKIRRVLTSHGLVLAPTQTMYYREMADEVIRVHASALIPTE